MPPDPDRSQGAGAEKLRRYSAPALARRDRAAQIGAGAEMGGGGNGAPLSPDEQHRRAEHRRLQRKGEVRRRAGQAAGPPRPDRLRSRNGRGIVRGRAARLPGAAQDRADRRRTGRSDGDGGQGDRGADPAPVAEEPRRRHPPDHGDPAPQCRCHHRRHQGEFADPHQLQRHQPHRFAHHSGRTGCGTIAGQGRHAVQAEHRRPGPRARAVRFR